MALIIISTGDFQIRWNVMSMSFSERESGKWPLALGDCYHSYLICNDFIQHSRRYLLATPIVPQLSKGGFPVMAETTRNHIFSKEISQVIIAAMVLAPNFY